MSAKKCNRQHTQLYTVSNKKSREHTPEDQTTNSTLVEAAKKPSLGRKLLYYEVRRMKTHYETQPSIQGSKAPLRVINLLGSQETQAAGEAGC